MLLLLPLPLPVVNRKRNETDGKTAIAFFGHAR